MTEFFGLFFGILLGAVVFAAWLTHVIVCISAQLWLFLIAGAIMAPIGGDPRDRLLVGGVVI